MGHFGVVDETTKRLVGRCARVIWLREDISDAEGENRSPTNLKQRLLSVDMPSAMESSTSVLEVAAQKSKPGLQTPSREKDGVASSGIELGSATLSLGTEKSPFEVEGEA